MAVGKDSPNRRRSIAVTNQNKPIVVPKGRRRAHSVVPGDRLSPLAKARRSLAPRKSILKASITLLNNNDSQPSSQSSQPLSQASTNDDLNTTQSMDITQDFRTRIHDNTSRKSLGRRVSFAEHAQVRLFQIPDNNHTNSTTSPQSSPTAPSSDDNIPAAHFDINDENDYPRPRRRSSIRPSFGGEGEDMDLTSVIPNGYPTGSAIADEEFDEDYYDDMEVTEVIQGDLIQRRSLSLGGARQPLTQISSATDPQGEEAMSDDQDHTQSMEEDSQINSDAPSDQSGAMEFTVPLSHSLRPPPQEDEAWLALRQITHSGDTPIEPELHSDDDVPVQIPGDGMNLDDAMERLQRARESLSLQPSQETSIGEEYVTYAGAPPVDDGYQDDSVSSTEDSFRDDIEDGNRTLNVSKIFGRASLGNDRMSTGYADSTMEESEIYGSIIPVAYSTPRPSLVSQPTVPTSTEPATSISEPIEHVEDPDTGKSSVFHPPEAAPPTTSRENTAEGTHPAPSTLPFAFSFTPKATTASTSRSSSPSKTKPKLAFSAAFAPPVSRPSPRKRRSSMVGGTIPEDRARLLDEDGNTEETGKGEPSPQKRQAITSKRLAGAGQNSEVNTFTPNPLSPSKKVPASKIAPRASLSLRRPSGYFARRKSLAVGIGSSQANKTDALSTQKRPNRMSMGSTPTNIWTKGKEPIRGEANRQKTKVLESSVLEMNEENNIPTTLHRAVIQAQATHDDQEDDIDMELDPVEEQAQNEVLTKETLDENIPSISIEQFFTLTGIKFMDELTAPRRSVHHPSRATRDPADISLAEYAVAVGIDIPQLVLFTRVSKDLQAWMEKSKADLAQAEEEAFKVTPELFVEYARADEEGQAELLHQLNLIRTNTRGLSKSDWYDWKLQWVEGLGITAEQSCQSLEEDAKSLQKLRAAADELLPLLEKEYQEIMTEFEREKAEVAEIEASDQDYLNELKASIAEQNIEVEALQAEVVEGNETLKWTEDRLEEIELEKKETLSAIHQAERILQVQGNGTGSEVFRLKDELEYLEDLHMFRVVKVSVDVFEYIYASQFRVSVPCRDFIPLLKKMDITRLDKARSKFKDDFPIFSDVALNGGKQLFNNGHNITVRKIIHRLSDYWSSCAQVRLQLKLLNVKYPVEIMPISPSRAGFRAKAMVMFSNVKGKAFISFIFAFDTLSRWPFSINSLGCEVDVAYGPIDRSAVFDAVQTRLQQATHSDNYACLLDACIEAQEMY
ncbi:Spc7 kinetochore protein-domain-containing protein [Cyathus striatus]|nr:Spc7 kinetochore protein-domain-containing protein [Cyathus striatus]